MRLNEISISYERKEKLKDMPQITSSNLTVKYFRKIWKDIDYIEKAYILLLSRSNRILGHRLLSQGGTSATVICTVSCFQTALKCNASAIILAHNHPSGNIMPSKADILLTKKIKEGGILLNISLLDHIIITSESYYSFVDEGIID